MGDSIRVVVDSAVNLARNWKMVVSIVSTVGTLGALAWVKAIEVSMWASGVARSSEVTALSKRVEALEQARDAAARAEYEERAATVSTLRTMAGEAAARARPRDSEAPSAARARFDELILRRTAPLTALDIVMREAAKR